MSGFCRAQAGGKVFVFFLLTVSQLTVFTLNEVSCHFTICARQIKTLHHRVFWPWHSKKTNKQKTKTP